MMTMTVRECIEKMRKVSQDVIYTNNGTKIILLEINPLEYDHIGTVKFKKDGQVILRRILCTIKPSKRTKGIEELKTDKNIWMYDPGYDYNYFRENDFCVPERKMNEFISLNGGIDTYRTISESYYMMVDTLAMMEW